HCLAIRKPVERSFDVDIACGLENRREHPFGHRENVVRCYERSFDVDLRKLRLPVRAQILVPKTFCDLEISFDAGHHEQLFVLLGRLWQRVKFSRRQSAWYQKIARAFW